MATQIDPFTTPALAPPPGVQSNFVDPPSLMPAVIALMVFVLGIMSLFFGVRLFVNFKIVRKLQTEDWFCILAYFGVAAYAAVFIYIEDFGLARHQWDINLAMFGHMAYYVNILYCLYAPATAFAKLSVLFQIKRIFTTRTKGLVYWVLWVSIVANSIAYLGLFLTYVFQCWPREAIWNPTIKGKCINGNQANLAAGILNIISDVEGLLLPAWAIFHLSMPIKRKLSVAAVFAVGLIACAIGVAGVYFRIVLLTETDFTFYGSILGMLVVSEMATVVVVGCFPFLPRFYHFLRGHPNGMATKAQNKGSHNNSMASDSKSALNSVRCEVHGTRL